MPAYPRTWTSHEDLATARCPRAIPGLQQQTRCPGPGRGQLSPHAPSLEQQARYPGPGRSQMSARDPPGPAKCRRSVAASGHRVCLLPKLATEARRRGSPPRLATQAACYRGSPPRLATEAACYHQPRHRSSPPRRATASACYHQARHRGSPPRLAAEARHRVCLLPRLATASRLHRGPSSSAKCPRVQLHSRTSLSSSPKCNAPTRDPQPHVRVRPARLEVDPHPNVRVGYRPKQGDPASDQLAPEPTAKCPRRLAKCHGRRPPP